MLFSNTSLPDRTKKGVLGEKIVFSQKAFCFYAEGKKIKGKPSSEAKALRDKTYEGLSLKGQVIRSVLTQESIRVAPKTTSFKGIRMVYPSGLKEKSEETVRPKADFS